MAAGAVRDMPLDVLSALWIGAAQEWSRHWLEDEALTPPGRASRLLADAAWLATEDRGRTMTRTAALPMYEEFVAGCRKDAAERVQVERRGDHAVVTMHDRASQCALGAADRAAARPPQAIAMEEFSEPMCFTTEVHPAGVAALR
jgi:hypothetical protein